MQEVIESLCLSAETGKPTESDSGLAFIPVSGIVLREPLKVTFHTDSAVKEGLRGPRLRELPEIHANANDVPSAVLGPQVSN